jgi:hypothetical protein
VTLAWPAGTPAGALPNLGFEAGNDGSWRLGNRWVIDSSPLVETGTQSAKYDGPGQSSTTHSQAVPVAPGTTITATARFSKGTTREDFAGGGISLFWLDANGNFISASRGNVVNTGSAAFQNSTVTGTAPAGAALVTMELSATRDLKGRARDKVYVDNVSWNHSYAIGGGQATNYAVVIRVRDGRGCQATLSQTIGAVSGFNGYVSGLGTLAWYRLEGELEGEGLNVDSSGNGYTGNLGKVGSIRTAGIAGGAGLGAGWHNPAGSSNYEQLKIGTSASGAWSICIFANFTNTGAPQWYLADRSGNDMSVIYGFVSRTVEMFSQSSVGDPRPGSQIDVLTAGLHQIVYTYNNGNFRGYRDGVLVFSTTRSLTFGGAQNVWNIGQTNVNGNRFGGPIFDFQLYNRALTESEILQMWSLRDTP